MRGTTRSDCNCLQIRCKFQSTSLLRGTTNTCASCWAFGQISIHVPLARDDRARQIITICHTNISIHVPLARDDFSDPLFPPLFCDFNPRPSCEGRRKGYVMIELSNAYFNPRPSCEGRPPPFTASCMSRSHFNPRPSCEGRR